MEHTGFQDILVSLTVSDLRPKVLYLSYDGMTDVLGGSQVMPYLLKLSKEYHIHILSFEKESRLLSSGERVRRFLGSNGIEWRTELFSSGFPVLPKLWDRKKMIRAAEAWHSEKRFDLVHCRSYVAAEAGWKLQKKFGVKFLFDMRGFWVDERVEGGIWNLRNPVYGIAYKRYKALEEKMLMDADGVICLTKPAFQTLLKWNVSEKKMAVITCAADLEHFKTADAAERNRARQLLGIPQDAKTLVYLGSLGTWYLSAEMMEFYSVFRQQGLSRFLILTPDKEEKLRALASDYAVPQKEVIITKADRDEVPRYLAAADAGIFFIRPSFSKTASSPTKLGEMLACGLPVIANSGIGDVDEVLEKAGTGILIRHFSKNDYQNACKEFFAHSWSAKNIREQAEKYFDLERGVGRYRECYKRLLS